MARNGNKHDKQEYVDLKDGRYWTKQALAKKYGVSEWTIYDRVRRFDINTTEVFGTTLYKDDVRYEKQTPPGTPANLNKASSYVVLFQKVEKMEVQLTKLETGIQQILDMVY